MLVIGFVMVLAICYKGAISKTLFLKGEIERLERENLDLGSLAGLSFNIAERERFADSVLGSNNIKGGSVQNSLLEFLNGRAETDGFSIVEFLEPHRYVEDGVGVTSYRFTLRGSYADMERVIYQLENRYSFGEISHLSFKRERDYRRGRDYLECSVILESYVSN